MSEGKEVVLGAYLERTAKYTGSWKKRYVHFDGNTKHLSYGESKEKASKCVMTLSKIMRCAEFDEKLHRGHADLFSIVVDGVKEDGSNESWKFRFPDESTFNSWYDSIRDCLAHAGSMTSKNFGLPPQDPRSGLKFVDIPVEYLLKFSLLEKAIVYFFHRVQLFLPPGIGPTGGKTTAVVGDLFFMVGDKFCYVFRPSADVVRCFDLRGIQKVFVGEGTVALQLAAPEHDVLIKNAFGKSFELVGILQSLYKNILGADLPMEPFKSPLEELATKLKLDAREGFKMNVGSPTPKVKLRQALDKFEKQNGVKFSAETAMKLASASRTGESKSMDRQQSERSASFAPGVDISDPMVVMLCKLNLRQYVNKLFRQHIDMDMLTCMEPNDLCNFGINDPKHREIIVNAANGVMPDDSSVPNDSLDVAPPPPKEVILDDSDDDLDVQSPNAAPPVVNLDSDDDDDLPAPGELLARAGMIINLDDSDDEEDLLPINKVQVVVNLDSDDDDI